MTRGFRLAGYGFGVGAAWEPDRIAEFVEVCRSQIGPVWIGFRYQSNFLAAQPSFQLFFSGDCVVDVAKEFEVDERVEAITRGKARDEFLLVFPYATLDVIGDTDV